MIDMRYKPFHLPQVSAPYTYVLGKLKDEGVKYKAGDIDPHEVQPMQGIVALDKISKICPRRLKPIWMSMDNKVLDGHHRYGSALSNEVPLPYFQIMLPAQDAVRVLNKIQDIYEYEDKVRIEELTHQEHVDNINSPEMADYLSAITEEAREEQEILNSDNKEKVGRKRRKINGYRHKPVNENSPIGNFFSVKPVDGHTKYEIEFDNMLETDKIGIHSHGQNPIELLANAWFPNVKFDKIAKKYNAKPHNLMCRAIAENAMKMGYDGIKYGDIIIQGLK